MSRSFCTEDADHAWFRVAREFRVYVRSHFANTIQTDSPIQLACRFSTNTTQNVDRISRLNRAGLRPWYVEWVLPERFDLHKSEVKAWQIMLATS